MGKLVRGVNDLATVRPDLAARWHPTLNGNFSPEHVTAGSHNMAWWVCPKGHEFDMAISKATRPNAGCPVCSGKRLFVGQNDLATTHPEILAAWSPLNTLVTPQNVQAGTTSRKVLWRCQKGHDYSATPANKVLGGTECPYCAGQKVLAGFNDMETTHPELARQFHPTQNGNLTTKNTVAGSSKILVWICDANTNHIWKAAGYSRVTGSGCPFCTGQKILPGENDLATLKPQLIDEWDFDLNLGKSPSEISPGSKQRVWWRCQQGHSWLAEIHSRASTGRSCPYCTGQKALTGYNDLETTHPDLLAEWDFDANVINPRNIIAGTNRRLSWVCSTCSHRWVAQGNKRVTGQGCPMCSIGGYQPSKPSVFYFLEHSEWRSRKVGITNRDAIPNRVQGFERLGWTVVRTWSNSDGLTIQKLESSILTWIRDTLMLPPYLSRIETGHQGGWSETFSEDGPTNQEIVARIEAEFARLSAD